MKAPKFAALSLFADDIREEIGDINTVVGIYPDNILVPALPGMLAKLACYTRVIFDPNYPPTNMRTVIRFEDGPEIASNVLDDNLIATAVRDTKAKGGLVASIISRAVFGGVSLTQPCRIVSVAEHDGEETIAGFVSIALSE